MVATLPFSILVIARDEAHTLPLLAGSLRAFLSAGAELVVIDTGSSDDTARVAREFGARVESVAGRFHSTLSEEQAAAIEARFARGGEAPLVEAGQLLFDYASARQFASERASNDFVWHVDASDVVLAADLEFLASAVRGGRAHSFDYFLEVERSRFRVWRFFDRRQFAWRGRVHERPFRSKPEASGERVSCSPAQLSLRHSHGEKTRNYLAGLALQVMEDGATPRWRHFLGRQLLYERRYRSAIGVLREHARMSGATPEERARSLEMAGECWEALERPQGAAACYLKALRIDLSRRTPLLRLGRLFQARGDFQRSVACAAAALMLPRSNAFVDENENDPADPHALLYWGLFWLGRRDEARAHWETCRRLAPDNAKFEEDGRLFAGRS